MKSPAFSTHNRRIFLKYLAGSPYVAALGGIRAFAERAPEIAEVMADPKEAFSVMDFEELRAARSIRSTGHSWQAEWTTWRKGLVMC